MLLNNYVATAAKGSSSVRPLSAWLSQVRQMQSLPTRPVPLVPTPPTTTLTKATGVSAAKVENGGKGYAVGNILTVAGGTYAVPALLRVTAVGDGGAVTAVTITRPGVYEVAPDAPAAVTGSKGATFQLTMNAGVASSMQGQLWLRSGPAFRFLGYSPKDIVSGYRGNMVSSAGVQAHVEFISDAPVLDFKFLVYSSIYDLYVDGQRIADTSVTTDKSGAPYIYTVDWGGISRPRLYRLSGINMAFGGVITEAAYTVWSPAGAKNPLVWQLGDSYTFGTGATQTSFNDFRIMCDSLGLDGLADGIGGTGWTSTGAKQPQTRIENQLSNITETPDIVMLSLGYNDIGGDIELLKTNWKASIDLLRQKVPLAQLIQIGVATPIGATDDTEKVRTALKELCDAESVPYIDVNDWVNAKNKGLYTRTDNVHPTDAGHIFRGLKLARAVSELIGAGSGNHFDANRTVVKLDRFTWEGSAGAGVKTFTPLTNMEAWKHVAGNGEAAYLEDPMIKIPARQGVSKVDIVIRLWGDQTGGGTGAGSSSLCEWSLQTRQEDAETIINGQSSMIFTTDIQGHETKLVMYTVGIDDFTAKEGFLLGIVNGSNKTITLSKIEIIVFRTINPEF